jgi:glyoxylase-like metal-dependent hydrolase (beta-lactamase superfamily II)
MRIETFFDPSTYTLTYLVWDEATRDAVVIDPVHDFDPLAVRFSSESVDQVAAAVEREGLTLHYVLETHAHADHISGSQLLKERLGAKVAIGKNITLVQDVFGPVFNRKDLSPDAFDALLEDGEVLKAGSLAVRTIATPGHTPACVTFHIGDAIFTGDALFMPDFGTGRCDFPKGSADKLYESIQKLYALPDSTRVFVGHDYQPGGRELAYETTIGESKASNKQLTAETSREDFVKFRTERDAVLRPPRLIFQSIQANVDAGRLPAPDDNGMTYLKLPIGVL